MLRFDWDERKNKSNRIKHGIWFEEAESVFSDPHGRLFYDPEHSEHEDRFIPRKVVFAGLSGEADPHLCWGRPMARRKKQVSVLCGTAVARD